MKILMRLQAFLPVILCVILSLQTVSAQTYIRYVNPDDLSGRALYDDTILTSIEMPMGVAKLFNYPKLNMAAYELAQVLQDPSIEVLQVFVCGSTSPEGLSKDNVKLSNNRTEAVVAYIQSITNLPTYKIRKQSLAEDWDRLAELVIASDLPESYKYEILYIIRTLDSDDRKAALQNLQGGLIWKILEKEFFPRLRCVRFAIFCKEKPCVTQMAAPVAVQPVKQEEDYKEPAPEIPVVIEKPVAPEVPVVPTIVTIKDTVYVRDTVYVKQESVIVKEILPQEQIQEPKQLIFRSKTDKPVTKPKTIRPETKSNRKYWDTPLLLGIKTNVLADVMAIGMGGVEIQLAKRLSLDLSGWYTNYNMFCREDKHTNVYGFTPELRWWVNEHAMERGSFFGIHGRAAWYTLQWTDGYLYQNGLVGDYNGNAGNNSPAWSIGLTYGYSFALDKKANWGVELLLGLGYGNYSQNRGVWNDTDSKWLIYDSQNNTHIGITRAAINLTYRFSVRKVKPEYYTK